MVSKRAIIRNVISNWSGMAVFMIVSFFLSPFIVHSLGDQAFGIWVLVGSLTGYFGLLDFGIRPALVKFISKYRALENVAKINEIINSALLISYLIGSAALIGSIILAFFAPRIFVFPKEYTTALRILIIITGFNVATDFPFAIFRAIYNSFERFDLSNLISVSTFLLRSILVVVFLKLGNGLVAMGLIFLAAALVDGGIKWRISYKLFPKLNLKLKLASRQTLKMIYGFSIYTFIIGISVRLSFYTDSIVIGSLLTVGAVTFFAIASNLIEYLRNIVSQVSTTVTPVASGMDAKKDNYGLQKLLVIGTKYVTLIVLPAGFVLVVLGETFINLWMGPQYGPKSSGVVTILMCGYFGFLSQFVSGSVLMGIGKIKTISYIYLGSAVVNIVLSIILTRYWGIYGVALGTAIPLLIYGTFFLPVYICRTVGIGFFEYLARSYLPAIISTLPFILYILYLKANVTIDSLWEFGQLMALSVVIQGIFVFLIGLEKEHRRIILSRVQ